MKPTVGNIVHYFNNEDDDPPGSNGLIPRAAIITKVTERTREVSTVPTVFIVELQENDYHVWLGVFFPKYHIVIRNVQHSEEPKRGCWSWPARE